MTKVNVHFSAPEPWFDLELDSQSQAAYDAWLEAPNHVIESEAWDHFLAELERQLRPSIGTRGIIEEVY